VIPFWVKLGLRPMAVDEWIVVDVTYISDDRNWECVVSDRSGNQRTVRFYYKVRKGEVCKLRRV
jgi:hypothetical protein